MASGVRIEQDGEHRSKDYARKITGWFALLQLCYPCRQTYDHFQPARCTPPTHPATLISVTPLPRPPRILDGIAERVGRHELGAQLPSPISSRQALERVTMINYIYIYIYLAV